MRKIALITLSLTFVLTLAAGCGSTDMQINSPGYQDNGNQTPVDTSISQANSGGADSVEDNSGGADSVEDNPYAWQTVKLPEGFPQYPEGEIIVNDFDEDTAMIYIINTDEEIYKAYISELETVGWSFFESGDERDTATKDDTMLSLRFSENSVQINLEPVRDYRSELIGLWHMGIPGDSGFYDRLALMEDGTFIYAARQIDWQHPELFFSGNWEVVGHGVLALNYTEALRWENGEAVPPSESDAVSSIIEWELYTEMAFGKPRYISSDEYPWAIYFSTDSWEGWWYRLDRPEDLQSLLDDYMSMRSKAS